MYLRDVEMDIFYMHTVLPRGHTCTWQYTMLLSNEEGIIIVILHQESVQKML